MASVGDFVKDVTPAERAELDAALRMGEMVRWATRPLVKRGVKEVADYVLMEAFAIIWLSFPLSAGFRMLTASGGGYNETLGEFLSALLAVCILLLFIAIGLFIALTPWRRRRRRQRTLYVLTKHRALVLTPGYFSWKVYAFPLWEHVLRSSIVRPRGGGDLIFTDQLPHGPSYDAYAHGFTYLPNLQEARRELNEAVNDLLDAAEQHLGNRPS